MSESDLAFSCATCGKAATARCGTCDGVAYCSEECQVKDWSRHAPSCRLTFSVLDRVLHLEVLRHLPWSEMMEKYYYAHAPPFPQLDAHDVILVEYLNHRIPYPVACYTSSIPEHDGVLYYAALDAMASLTPADVRRMGTECDYAADLERLCTEAPAFALDDFLAVAPLKGLAAQTFKKNGATLFERCVASRASDWLERMTAIAPFVEDTILRNTHRDWWDHDNGALWRQWWQAHMEIISPEEFLQRLRFFRPYMTETEVINGIELLSVGLDPVPWEYHFELDRILAL